MSIKKKILHVRHSLGEGGITTFVQALVDLNKSSDTSHHILVWKELPVSDDEFDVVDMSKSTSRKKEFANLIQDYDSIFVHSLMPFMLIPLFKRKSNVYLFQHGITFGKGKKKIFKQLYYALIINFFGFKIICSSEFAKKKLLRKVPVFNKKLISIIGFGIDLPLQTNLVKNNDSVLRIGFAGRLVEQKKVSRIINALELIKNDIEVEVHIAGNGPLQNNLEKRSKEFINSKITFVFYGFFKNMNDFYSKLDVFILPSVGESFGLVVLEALSRGIPSIVFSDTGACVEFIEHDRNGYVVNSEVELSKKIAALSDVNLRNELKLKMGTMGLKNYDISNTRSKLDVL
ncbi:glycosyltransferase family 4 protein [Psychroserpens mesophilus]|uniref:glycosyltransferase family 4 protein n=1 Tax=Psychroserpens mesophilus TaxID=325473 RepID=UPI003D6625FE